MLGYHDHVRITRRAPAAAGPDSGWSEDGAETVVYDGPADVQDGTQTLEHLDGGAGERAEANAVVFLPPVAAAAFAGVRLNDDVSTPVGDGTVVGASQTDVSLAVRLTRSAPAVPVVLS